MDKRNVRDIVISSTKYTLASSMLTYEIYKNNYGNLFADLVENDRKQMQCARAMEQYNAILSVSAEGIEKMDADEQQAYYEQANALLADKANLLVDTTFSIRVIACMVATSEYPQVRDIKAIISDLPLDLLNNQDVLELMTLLRPQQDKKRYAVSMQKATDKDKKYVVVVGTSSEHQARQKMIDIALKEMKTAGEMMTIYASKLGLDLVARERLAIANGKIKQEISSAILQFFKNRSK